MARSDHLDSTERTMLESEPMILSQASIGNSLLGQEQETLIHYHKDGQSAASTAQGVLETPRAHNEAILNLITV